MFRSLGMDAFFAPYLFPQENYFIGGLVVLIIGLLGWRWHRSAKKKDGTYP
ncbi:MAG: hypothetical protein R3B74_00310 [Nitrospirales bacterium]|nr:hypothetical protein [Nitrospirales bacterium]